jgi:AraC-like DNA-binding protein
MLLSNANAHEARELSAWLDGLQDPATTVVVDHAAQDRLDGQWRHDGACVPGHINWLVLAGEIAGRVAGQALRIRPGGWLCVAPLTPLFFWPQAGRQRIRLMRFRLHLTRAGAARAVPGGGFLIPDAQGLHAAAARLISDRAAGDPFAERRRRGLLLSLYGEAFRRLCRPATPGARSLEEGELALLEELVAAMAPGSPAPAQLARRLNMTPDTFARAFRRAVGQSPRRWLAGRRIAHAAELLLRKDASATQVADWCGYADVFHFCRSFRQVMGCGTRDWRRRHGVA